MDEKARRLEQTLDRILLGVAGGATLLVAIGAATLVMAPNPSPHFRGAEHLAIFARPSSAPPRMVAPTGDPGIDMTPVGAIGARPPGATTKPPAPAQTGPLARWSVQDVIGDQAYLIGPEGVVAARIGADLGEAGVLERVVVERGGFAVLTSKGRIGPAR